MSNAINFVLGAGGSQLVLQGWLHHAMWAVILGACILTGVFAYIAGHYVGYIAGVRRMGDECHKIVASSFPRAVSPEAPPMRDTLLLVLACIGGTSVILTGCLAMWVAGNACVDWYDRIVKEREQAARAERVTRRVVAMVAISRQRPPPRSVVERGLCALLQRGRTDCRKWPSGGRPRGVGRVRERTLRFGELFAGAGGMSLGLHRAGMDCQFHAEIAAFPRKVLAHRFPDVPLLSDVRALSGGRKTAAWMRANYGGKIDLLAGGSPCQDLSVAGKRAGLAGARSSLFFRQVRLWRVLDAPYILWENVAGALSSNNGADFAAVLSAIVGATVTVPRDGWGGDESGGGVAAGPRAVAAWRLLDAQWFGVPQRRLRVFVLGARAGGCDPAEVLLEPESLYRNPPTRGEARQGSAGDAGSRVAFSFGSHAGAADGSVTNESHASGGPTGFGINEELANTLRAGRTSAVAHVAFDWQNSPSQGAAAGHIIANTVTAREAKGWNPAAAVGNGPVTHGIPRRLMPIECERLMSWPDNWTNVPRASDAARYKACGNGVVSNVAQWIGERLQAIHGAMRGAA